MHRPPGTAGPLARLAVLGGAYAVAFLLVYYVSVRTVPGRQIGDASLRGALSASPAVQGTVDAVLNVVSIASLLGAAAVVAVIALVRLARVRGLAALALLVGANGSTWLLKNVVLARPDLGIDEVSPPTLNSMPSGHSTAAFSAVAALVFVLPRAWRLAAATAGAGYATVTALATMSAGWHRAGDSMAAFLLVGVWTVAAAAAVVVAGVAEDRAAGPSSSSRWLVACATGCLALGTAVDLALAVTGPLRESAVGSWIAFLAAALLIAGTLTAVLVGVLRALDWMDSAPVAAVRSAAP